MLMKFWRWLIGPKKFSEHVWTRWELKTRKQEGFAAAFGGTVSYYQERHCTVCGFYQQNSLPAFSNLEQECKEATALVDEAPVDADSVYES